MPVNTLDPLHELWSTEQLYGYNSSDTLRTYGDFTDVPTDNEDTEETKDLGRIVLTSPHSVILDKEKAKFSRATDMWRCDQMGDPLSCSRARRLYEALKNTKDTSHRVAYVEGNVSRWTADLNRDKRFVEPGRQTMQHAAAVEFSENVNKAIAWACEAVASHKFLLDIHGFPSHMTWSMGGDPKGRYDIVLMTTLTSDNAVRKAFEDKLKKKVTVATIGPNGIRNGYNAIVNRATKEGLPAILVELPYDIDHKTCSSSMPPELQSKLTTSTNSAEEELTLLLRDAAIAALHASKSQDSQKTSKSPPSTAAHVAHVAHASLPLLALPLAHVHETIRTKKSG